MIADLAFDVGRGFVLAIMFVGFIRNRARMRRTHWHWMLAGGILTALAILLDITESIPLFDGMAVIGLGGAYHRIAMMGVGYVLGMGIAAVALVAHVHSLQTIERRASLQRLSAVRELVEDVGAQTTLKDVASTLIVGMRERFDVDRVGVFVVDESTGEARGLMGTDAEGNLTDISDDGIPGRADHDPERDWWEVTDKDVGMNVVAPARADGTCVALVCADNALSTRTITDDQIQYLLLMAHELGSVIQRVAAVEELERRARYLRAVADASQALIAATPDIPWDAVVQALGPASNASRAYVFINRQGPAAETRTSQVAEWCAPGVEPEIDNPELQDSDMSEHGFQRWAHVLSGGGVIAGLVEELPPEEHEFLKAQDIRAVVVLPLIVEGEWAGFVGFDNCVTARAWTPSEIDLLRVAAAGLAQAIERSRAVQDLAAKEQLQRGIFESIVDPFHMVDRDRRILFANPSLLRKAGVQLADVLGRPCWEVYQGRTEPCEACAAGDAMATDEHVAHEQSIIDPDGEEHHFEVHGYPVRDTTGAIIGAVEYTRDITERVRAAEALLRSKEDWERTFDAVSDIIVILDTEHRIVRANRAMADACGIQPDQLVGRRCCEVVHGTDAPPEFCPLNLMLADGEEHAVEVREPAMGGDFLVSVSPLHDADGKLIGGVHTARDISERKRHEAQIAAESRQRAAMLELAHSLSETLAVSEVIKRSVEGVRWALGFDRAAIFLCNKGAEMLEGTWGTDRDGNTVAEDEERMPMGPEDWASRILENDASAIVFDQFDGQIEGDMPPRMAGVAHNAGVPLRTGDEIIGMVCVDNLITGRPFAEKDLGPLHLLARLIAIAITNARSFEATQDAARALHLELVERRRAETALRFEQVVTSTALRHAPVGIIVTDAEGVVLMWNEYMTQTYSVSREDAEGKRITERFPALDKEGIVEHLLRVMAGGEPFFEPRWEHYTSQAGERVIDLAMYPLLGEDGEALGVAMLNDDITDEVRREAQLAQAERMEVLGSLAGGVAHDFNNIIQAINGNLELASRKDADGAAPYIHNAHDAGLRAADLVRQLLIFSTSEEPQRTGTDVSVIAQDTAKLLRQTIDRRIGIELNVASGLWPAYVDPAQVHQVILNLCVNARDAVVLSLEDQRLRPARDHEAFRIALSLANVTVDAEALDTDANARPGEFVLLSVADNGIGMDEETQSRIFEPFYSTKGTAGTGLGLATVYRVVKQHGGWIEVSTSPGRGAEFRLYFPRHVGEIARPRKDEPLIAATPGDKAILVVDDEPQIRSVLTQLLAGLGYSMIEAEDGEQALAVIREQRERIGLVILDSIMPRLAGRETLAGIKEIAPEIKVMICSGYVEPEEAREFVEMGASAMLAKPFTLPALCSTIREALDG